MPLGGRGAFFGWRFRILKLFKYCFGLIFVISVFVLGNLEPILNGLGPILCLFWAILGLSWAFLGPRGCLGTSSAHAGTILGLLGRYWDEFWGPEWQAHQSPHRLQYLYIQI